MKRGTEVPRIQRLIVLLEKASKKSKASLWKRIAEFLKKPRRKRIEVNLFKVNKHAREGETIIVPGKLLSEGRLEKRILLSAINFSQAALRKASEKAQVVSVEELVEKNPSGKGVRIII